MLPHVPPGTPQELTTALAALLDAHGLTVPIERMREFLVSARPTGTSDSGPRLSSGSHFVGRFMPVPATVRPSEAHVASSGYFAASPAPAPATSAVGYFPIQSGHAVLPQDSLEPPSVPTPLTASTPLEHHRLNDLDSSSPASAAVGSGRVRDWNAEFQALMDGISDEKILTEESTFRRLSELANDFVYCAQNYGRIIIAEKNLPFDRCVCMCVCVLRQRLHVNPY
jgi:hypothetical protein